MYFKMSDEIKELLTAMSKVQGNLEFAIRDKNNTFYKSKYADLAAVVTASQEVLEANGISVIQMPDIIEGKNVLWIILGHNSGQWMMSPLDLSDPKGMPARIAAMSYGRRGNYGAATGVVADDEDDDGNTAAGNPAPAGTGPLPHPNTMPPPSPTVIPANSKSAFLTKEQRDEWFNTVSSAIASALKLDELDKIKTTYKARMVQIQSLNNVNDMALLKRLMNAFEVRWEMLIPKADQPNALNVDAVMQQGRATAPKQSVIPHSIIDDQIPF